MASQGQNQSDEGRTNAEDSVVGIDWPQGSVFDGAEQRAMNRALRRGILSGYAATLAGFQGGPEVQALEEETADAFKAQYAIAVNSGTSALICAVGALMLDPKTVVVATPYSMSASAACVIPWGLWPEFLDISLDDYMVECEEAEVVIFVDLFGNLRRDLPRARYVIEDACQAAHATVDGRFAGTFGDIGVLSMNKYKAGGVGEGGMILTNDAELALNCQLIRNHGEVVCQEMILKGVMSPDDPRATLMGYNFRLPEISAALAREQLKKLPALVRERQDQADYLISLLKDAEGIYLPRVAKGVKPAWYRFPVRVHPLARAAIAKELSANLVNYKLGYVAPIHQQPIYGEHSAILPNVEQAEREMILLAPFGHGYEHPHFDQIARSLIGGVRNSRHYHSVLAP